MVLALALPLLLAAPAQSAPPAAEPDAGPRMGQAVLAREVPIYPGATEQPIDVGETIEAKGVPMNVKSFMTADPPRKVLDFYETFFKKTGLPMLGNGDMVIPFPYPSVTVLDEQRGIDISVITIPSADHRTMVLLARADMQPLTRDLGRAEAERYGGLVAYPHGVEPSSVRFGDGELHRTQVTFDTADAPAEVLAFYQKAYPGPSQVGQDGALEVKESGGTWRIVARRDARTQQTVVTALHSDAAGAATEPGAQR